MSRKNPRRINERYISYDYVMSRTRPSGSISPVKKTKNICGFYIDIDLGVSCGSDIAIPNSAPRYSANLRARIAKRDLAVALVALAPTHTSHARDRPTAERRSRDGAPRGREDESAAGSRRAARGAPQPLFASLPCARDALTQLPQRENTRWTPTRDSERCHRTRENTRPTAMAIVAWALRRGFGLTLALTRKERVRALRGTCRPGYTSACGITSR